MAKSFSPYDYIGARQKTFDPGEYWIVVDYDPETREHIVALHKTNGVELRHPHCPDKMTLNSAPTKRVRLI